MPEPSVALVGIADAGAVGRLVGIVGYFGDEVDGLERGEQVLGDGVDATKGAEEQAVVRRR